MAKITKKVDPGTPSGQRVAVFTDADAVVGDILMVKDSIGKSGTHVILEAGQAFSVRLNVLRTVFAARQGNYGLAVDDFGWELPNMASGLEYNDGTQPVLYLDPAETLTFDGDLPIDTIQLNTVSGSWRVTCI